MPASSPECFRMLFSVRPISRLFVSFHYPLLFAKPPVGGHSGQAGAGRAGVGWGDGEVEV